MDTGDLLLLVTLIILGLLGLAYVVFVLGNRGTKQYLLSCPPCAVGGTSTTASAVVAPQLPPPGVVATPVGAIGTMPSVPPVTMPITPPVTMPITPPVTKPSTSESVKVPLPVPLTPLAPAIPPIPTGSTLLFRNRANGRYLSVCQGCSKSASLAIMAHESNYKASYVQWVPTANGNGWMLSSKFNSKAGVLQPLAGSTIYTLKQNDVGVSSTINFTPADSQGYLMTVGGQAIQTCCAQEQTPKCACPQFSDSAQLGVTAASPSATSPADARQIWDLYVLQADGKAAPLLQLSPSQRFLMRHR